MILRERVSENRERGTGRMLGALGVCPGIRPSGAASTNQAPLVGEMAGFRHDFARANTI
jgi:hypothetical protein